MNKQIFNELINWRKELEKKIENTERRLETLPQGKLLVQKSGNKKQYYLDLGRKPDKGGKVVRKRKYIKKENMEYISALAQKEYDINALKIARKELILLNELLDAVSAEESETYYTNLNPLRRSIVEPMIEPVWKKSEAWMQESYIGLPTDNLTTDYYTDNGERVRSKSEILIANALKAKGIPYKYECPLTLHRGIKVYPDFTCMNITTGKIMYWEHLGKMDDTDYCCRNMEKILKYESAGIYPGIELILTHELSYSPLGTTTISNIIEAYLM